MARSGRIPLSVCVAMIVALASALQAQVPGAPVLISPANGASNQPVELTMEWNTVSGASSYTLQVASSSVFSSYLINQGGIATGTQIVSFAKEAVCFWRVSATGTGGTGEWSSIWSFNTDTVTPPQPPDVPLLSSPANGATNIILQPTISWNLSPGATQYSLFVSDTFNFDLTIFGVYATNTSYGLYGLGNGKTYYWKVKAENNAGWSAWSSAWSFTTGNTYAPPILVSPSNGATNQPLALTLSWDSVPTATSYELQGSVASSTVAGISVPYYAVNGLANTMHYTWSVMAVGPYGQSAWSTVYTFSTVEVAPTIPVLTYPSNNAVDISNNPEFTWQGEGNAATYSLQLSASASFASTIASKSALQGNQGALGVDLSYNSTCFWRMNAADNLGTSGWSSPWTFTVSSPVPSATPVIITPTDGETITQSTEFTWGLVAGATKYQLRIYSLSDHTELFDTVLSATQWNNGAVLANLSAQPDYAEVNAGTGSGFGPASNYVEFAIGGSSSVLHHSRSFTSPYLSLRNTSLMYNLSQPSQVEVSLFNLTGRKFSILNRSESSGSYTLSLKNRNLPAGVYFLQFKAGAMQKRMKVVLPGG